MLRQLATRAWLLIFSLLCLLVVPASAQTFTTYSIRGPGGAGVWGLGAESGTELVAFAFSELAPTRGGEPPPGPRVVFSLTRWKIVGNVLKRFQWYGDAPLDVKALTVATTLAEAKLDAEVTGTLEERDAFGVVVRRDVPGRLQVNWSATGALAITTLAVNNQASPFAVQLQAVGQGRTAQATATATVEGLGERIQTLGLGTILSPTSGTLTVGMQ